MVEDCRRRGAEEVIAEVEPLDIEPPARTRLLGQMDQHKEGDELSGAEERRGRNDEWQRHLVRLVPKALNRKGMRQHGEPRQDDKTSDQRARPAAPAKRDRQYNGSRAHTGNVGERGGGESPPAHQLITPAHGVPGDAIPGDTVPRHAIP